MTHDFNARELNLLHDAVTRRINQYAAAPSTRSRLSPVRLELMDLQEVLAALLQTTPSEPLPGLEVK
jgi:hypothetical protein